MNPDLTWILDSADLDCIEGLNRVCSLLQPLFEDQIEEAPDPVFIIGAPRSGTTLLYQLMARCLDLGYVNNFMARFWEAPAVGAYISKKALALEPSTHVESDLGRTSGPEGVHEFGYFWRRFFPGTTDYADSIQDQDAKRLVLEVRSLAKALGRRVAFKNLTCGLRIRVLARLFPGAQFVHVERDPYSNAVAILEARIAFHGSEDTWWSLVPQEIETFAKLPVAEQIAAQLTSTLAEIDSAVESTQINRIAVQYESLCREPGQTMQDLARALGASQARPWTEPLEPRFAGEPRNSTQQALFRLLNHEPPARGRNSS